MFEDFKNGGQYGGLDRWFAEKWVDIKTGKACGRQTGEKRKGYPACRPSKRINKDTPKTSSELSSQEKEKFKKSKTSSERINYQHRRKEFGGETNDSDMANKPNNPALWSKAKSLAKQKFDVYPSAYANGWAAKWYKSKGGTWSKAEYGMEIMDDGGQPNNPGFNALPEYVQQKIMSNMAYGGSPMYMQTGGEPDGSMALGQIEAAIDKLQTLKKFIQPDSDLEPWVSSKLTMMDHYTDAVSDYMQYNPEAQMMQQEGFPIEQMAEGGIPERYRNMGFSKVGAKKNSTRPGKKWMVLAKKGDDYKVVHGGYDGMKDYTQHGSEKRRERFWDRMGGKNSAKAKDPFSPLYWHKRFGTWAEGGQPMDPPNSFNVNPNDPDAKYMYGAKMAYYKDVLNNALRTKNPDSYDKFFSGRKDAYKTLGFDRINEYDQSANYNDYLSPNEMRQTLGDQYDDFMDSLQGMSRYNQLGTQKGNIVGDKEQPGSLFDINYGRRFATLPVNPRIDSDMKGASKYYEYNPQTGFKVERYGRGGSTFSGNAWYGYGGYMPMYEEAGSVPAAASNLNSTTSIVDFLKSQGAKSDYTTRKQLAQVYGINDYTGSYDQNIALMEAVRSGQPITRSVSKNPIITPQSTIEEDEVPFGVQYPSQSFGPIPSTPTSGPDWLPAAGTLGIVGGAAAAGIYGLRNSLGPQLAAETAAANKKAAASKVMNKSYRSATDLDDLIKAGYTNQEATQLLKGKKFVSTVADKANKEMTMKLGQQGFDQMTKDAQDAAKFYTNRRKNAQSVIAEIFDRGVIKPDDWARLKEAGLRQDEIQSILKGLKFEKVNMPKASTSWWDDVTRVGSKILNKGFRKAQYGEEVEPNTFQQMYDYLDDYNILDIMHQKLTSPYMPHPAQLISRDVRRQSNIGRSPLNNIPGVKTAANFGQYMIPYYGMALAGSQAGLAAGSNKLSGEDKFVEIASNFVPPIVRGTGKLASKGVNALRKRQYGGLSVGEEMEVTPEQLEMLRQQGYEFEII